MQREERLERAKRSLDRALAAKQDRDVSEELSSMLLNLTTADAKFSDIGTNEHEVRAALCLGYLAETKRLIRAAALKDAVDDPLAAIGKLMRRADEALADLNVKVDKELALFMEENDPFLKGMREAEIEKKKMEADLFAGLDLDSMDLDFSFIAESVGRVGPVIEIREEIEDYADIVITVDEDAAFDLDLASS